MSSFNLNFHQTFMPEREHLSKLLFLADNMFPMTKEEIFSSTGIPTGASSGKVEPHIKYSVYMGLLVSNYAKGRYKLQKTKLGKIIFEEDPYILEQITQLLCHINLLGSQSSAGLWKYLFFKVIPSLGLDLANDMVNNVVSNEFKKEKVNLTPFKNCYSNENSLGGLGFLEVTDNDLRFKKHRFNSTFRYLYAYALLSEWENIFSDRSEITSEELFRLIRWPAKFMWNEEESYVVLDSLTELDLISLNRQLSPVTIVRKVSLEIIYQKIYSLLV